MQTHTRFSAILLSGLVATSLGVPLFAVTAPAPAQAELAPPAEIAVDAPMTAVTLYRGRAMVTRSCVLPAEQGAFEVRIAGLPQSIDPASLAARATGAKVLDVRYGETVLAADAATGDELRATTKALDELRRASTKQELQGKIFAEQSELLNAIAAKAAGGAGKDIGSKELDPQALAAQIKFLGQAREELMSQRIALDAARAATADEIKALEAKVRSLGGRSKIERHAIVTVGKSEAGTATLALNYLVANAGWAPRYAVRATDAGDDALDLVTIELNAEISQRTGEEWKDIALTLSTAEPGRRPAPPEVKPEFLAVADRFDVEPPPMTTGRPSGPGGGGGGGYGDIGSGGLIGNARAEGGKPGSAESKAMYDEAFADAYGAGGAIVNYTIARKVTIPSDDSRTRSQRVASFDLKPEFTHVVHPIADPTVYLRAKTRNTTGTQLVAGEARLFVGDDSVGVAEFPEVAPGGELTLWLGGDARYEARRMLVEKDAREQGVFGKDDVIVWKWRLDITSGAKGSTQLEVIDRVPVSRNEKIKVELRDLSVPLSTDATYLADDRPRGILRWSFAMPGLGKDGKPSTRSISWSVRQSAPSGTRVVPADE
jgi:uncharacterized protein (TIGR02231 family)